MRQDIGYALRMLRKNPAFTIAAVSTLALGIGANTAIFSAVNTVLLKPLPYRDPGRLMQLWETHPVIPHAQLTYPDFVDWHAQAHSFADMAAYTFEGDQNFNLVTGGNPEQVTGTFMSGNLLPMLGVQPVLGRNFAQDEVQRGHDGVVLLGYSVWRGRFGSDTNIVGRSVVMNGRTFRVVGVLPKSIQFPLSADVALPLSQLDDDDRTLRKYHVLEAIGRLRPAVSVEAAQTELQGISLRLQRAYPATNNTIGAQIIPLEEQFSGEAKTPLLILFGAVGLILLIACANVANLLLARAVARKREISIRVALGANRGRLLKQLLIESTVLALAGGCLGLLLAAATIPALRVFAANQIPRAEEIRLDPGVLVFTSCLALLTGLVFGLIPALQLTRSDHHSTLRAGRSSGADVGRRSIRRLLIAAEVALAIVILIHAGLLVRSFSRLLAVDPGFRTDHLLTFKINLSQSKYASDAQINGFYDRLITRLASLPGVHDVTTVTVLPLVPTADRTRFAVDGQPRPEAGKFPVAQMRAIAPNYFHAMHIPIRAGRAFTEGEAKNQGPPVCIINEALARRFFSDRNPVGRRIVMGVLDPKPNALPIVGVVANTRDLGLASDADPEIYFAGTGNSETIVMRTAAAPLSLVSAVRGQVLAVDPEQPISHVRSMDEILAESVARRRFSTVLLAGFSGLALLLAAIGLYGVVSYAVAQRTQEIGLRMALGATRSRVFRLVLRESMLLSVAGLVTGFAAALATTRLLGNLLYGIQAEDPVTFIAVAFLLLLVSLLAAALPARRALRIDPMIALRSE